MLAYVLLSRYKYTNSSTAYYFASNNVIWDSSRAVDGNTNGYIYSGFCFASSYTDTRWWLVVLDNVSVISKINIYARTDCCTDRMNSMTFYASYDNITSYPSSSFYNFLDYQGPPNSGQFVITFNISRLIAKTIAVTKLSTSNLIEICEFEIFGHLYYKPISMIYNNVNVLSLYGNRTAIKTFDKYSPIRCSKTCRETHNCVSFSMNVNGSCRIFDHAGGAFLMIPP